MVENNLEMVDIEFNEENIKTEDKITFKKQVKSKMIKISHEYLKDLQKNHSKIRNIEYAQFQIQPYMRSPKFTNKLFETLFNMRCSMTRNIQSNFPGMLVH